ncbi:DHH family phosphoesterase [Paludicola sp. MB14-C6]|uniref:DHH family phosphoesterase n=1 Tax=Paludihabitans sp. MB14-C6 TaxID=3070656 RepID=UPI0027DB7E28|nr:DHH family phosphoesterase [Paludicola sp. MB14-C6]WMJ24131.1 DHH family phosphoesterase [Paludicola sp. MB14-C6]
MKRKKFWFIKPIYIILMAISVFVTGVIYFYNKPLFYILLPIVLVAVGYSSYRLIHVQTELYQMITTMGKAVTDSHDASLINFPLPSMIVSEQNEVLWYNEMFKDNIIIRGQDIFGANIQSVFGKDIYGIGANQGVTIQYNQHYYRLYSICSGSHTKPMYMVYFVDVTELQVNMLTMESKRPVVMMVLIDNYDEAIGNENNSMESRLIGEVRDTIQDFVDKTTGFIRRLDRDRYIMMIEKENLEAIIQNRFDVLDKVREIGAAGKTPVTLSIGVGVVETTFSKAEREARQALDMALGRGGDQAAIKTENGYEFFGGYSKGVEKRTKVKTRIVASALVELIKSADNVLIMGHKFADLDCLGSGIGMAKAASYYNKKVNIVLDSRRNLAESLVRKLVENDMQNLICLPDIAIDMVTDKTLLIIVDTHTQVLVESSAIYKKAKQVVVIDHHRKMVNHIENAVIFYHEPYASSASEMVTELVQYFGEQCVLTSLEAEALLAGIMLDTRNFVIKTGVRTFEAAAYLRRLGADTVEVRKLFASTMDTYQRKTRVVSSAEVYKQCAIAVCDFVSDDLRLIAPQAADELLGINNVSASFVLYEQDDNVNISARSMGDLNVQVLMEKLGGGGHLTMAGAQVPNSSCDKVRQTLLEIIDQTQLKEKPELINQVNIK